MAAEAIFPSKPAVFCCVLGRLSEKFLPIHGTLTRRSRSSRRCRPLLLPPRTFIGPRGVRCAALSPSWVDLSGSVGLCRALCRASVGPLSGLCRLTTVDPLSASVDLCRTNLDRYYACYLSVSVGLCRSVETLSACRPVGNLNP